MKDVCLIIGSTGFVGQWLRAALLDAGFRVRGFDTRPAGVPDEIVGDVFDAAALGRACAGVNVVCHLVALQSSRQHGWDAFHTVNVKTTARILEECRRAGVGHLVYFSTELVYGKQTSDRVREDAPLRPRGHYGKSKAMAEEVCRQQQGSDFRVTILRPCNILGPGKTRVVDELFDRVNRNAPVPLVGGTAKPWQVVDVRDVTRLTAHIVERRLVGVYNVASPVAVTAHEAYATLVTHARSSSRLIPVPAELFRAVCATLDVVGRSPLTPDQYHRLADSWIVDPSSLLRQIPYSLEHEQVPSLLDTYDAYMAERSTPRAAVRVPPVGSKGEARGRADGSRAVLNGQVVVVTGASRGIGRATAHAFARSGARVVLVGRDGATLEGVQRDIEAGGGQAMAVAADVRDEGQVAKVVQAALETWDGIDVLVNNAGVTHVAPLVEASSEQIRDILDVNLLGTILCTRAVLPHFLSRRRGHIVNVSSILGKRGVPRQAVYAASKAGILRLSEALRSELRPHGITVTSFCPSSTATAMNEQASAGDPALKQLVRRAFMQTPEGVARQIVRATTRRRREVVLSLPAKAIAAANAVCPGALDRLFARMERRR